MANNSTQVPALTDYSSLSWRQNLFAILLSGQLMSVPCYVFTFYHLLRNKIARKSLQNHAIIAVLMYNFLQLMIDLPMTLDFFRLGYRSPFIIPLCFVHAYVNYGIWYGAIHLVFWISIERHILIFYSNLMTTTRGRFLFHYLPLGIASIYAPILYFYLIVLCPCQRVYNPLLILCGTICFRRIVPSWFNWFESIVNYVFPILMTGVFSCTLVIRVVLQKRRLQQAIDWRRQRKMIIQLILVSAVYLVFDLPYVLTIIASWWRITVFNGYILTQYIGSFTYVPAIILPYANIFALPQLNQKLRSLMFWKARQRTIVPAA